MPLDKDGFEIVSGVLTDTELEPLRKALNSSNQAGVRGVANLPAVDKLLKSSTMINLLPNGELRLVRSLLFDKTPSANWPVAWHQDRTIAVEEHVDIEGYGPWSRKNAIPHVEPPATLLEQMVTLRIHLDPTPTENGALLVIPGSHRHGKLNSDQLAHWKVEESQPLSCEAGDVILMRPLLVHSSPRASNPSHRRVLHFEFAPLDQLHPLLRWNQSL